MRRSTDPGGWDRLPPGSVPGQTAPQGAYSVTPDADEIPTRPEAVDTDTLQLVRAFGDLSAPDRHRCVKLIKSWSVCPINKRVLISELANELAKGET